MTEVPAASPVPECNGSVSPEKGPLQVISATDEIAKSVRTVPYANAETSPDASPAKENWEENRNSLAQDIIPRDFDGEKQSEEKQEAADGPLQQGPAAVQDSGTGGQESQEGPGSAGTPADSEEPELGTVASPSGDTTGTLRASTDGRGNAAEEEEDEEEVDEEDMEEDEVQVIEIKKENGEASCLEQHDGSKEPSTPSSPGCAAPAETPGEQPSLGKKNDISRHSYSRYNTISYRRIRKGNTKQRIDEFESMMHL
ncbi:ermin, ERM-like protein [Columba livia]|uniref:Ermin n=1 Tax=Columba livia TaxID=8932 RepID=A0A2I0MG55_COLLI|nr:ermin [Columba livia]PKK28654.1 ermin, ERM-like protein [Columba livia]